MAAEQFQQVVDGMTPTPPAPMPESGEPSTGLWRQPIDSATTQPINSATTQPIDSATTQPITSPDATTTQPITPPPPMPESGAPDPATPPPPLEPPTPEPPAVEPPADGTTPPDQAEGTTPDHADGTAPPADPDAPPVDPDAPESATMVAPPTKPKPGGWEVDPDRLRGFSDAVVRARSYLDAVQMKVDRMQGAELTPQLGTSPVGKQLAKKFDDRLNSTDGLREMLAEAMKRMEKFVTSAEKAAKTYEEVEQTAVDTFDHQGYHGYHGEPADKPANGRSG